MVMNINTLIALLAVGLGSIYVFFSPLKIEQTKHSRDIPLLELHKFTMYEFDTKKLVDISNGEKAIRYKDRYMLYDFIFTDNSNADIVAISAKKGLYKNETLLLEDDVLYTKSDGLEFKSQKVFYNRSKGYVQSKVPYVAMLGENIVIGNYLFYDINKKLIRSKHVEALYHLTK